MEEALEQINWEDSSSKILLNPRLPAKESQALTSWVQNQTLSGHIWLASSGSQNKKLIALSKQAFLTSAKSVNNHLSTEKKDIWLNILPRFHVGGLAIEARAHLQGSKIFQLKEWSPHKFVTALEEQSITLTSMVPTHVHDIVKVQFRAPPRLRAVVVGGAALSPELYAQGRALGWPLLPSFGMTECCSQIATAGLQSLSAQDFPKLKILGHVQLRIDSNQTLSIRSEALMTGYLEGKEWNPIQPGDWYQTQDRAEIMDPYLKPLGRGDDFVKIGGESVSLVELRILLDRLTPPAWRGQVALTVVESERLGHELVLYVTPTVDAPLLKKTFDAKVSPFEKIRRVQVVPEIPRSDLGKIMYQYLRAVR